MSRNVPCPSAVLEEMLCSVLHSSAQGVFGKVSAEATKIWNIRNVELLSYEKRCESWAGLVQRREHWERILLMYVNISEAGVRGWCQIFSGAQRQDEEQWS